MFICFIFFFIVLFLFFLFLNSLTLNLIIWWRVFVLITLTFIFLQKKQGFYSISLNYFLLQEFIGFLFLVFVFFNIQLFILLIKVGVSPFHFWIFSIFSMSDNFILMWFLTFQKLPFLPVLFFIFNFLYFSLFFVGILFCYYQLFTINNYKFIIALSSTESFNWLLLGIFMGFFGFLLFSFYYFLNICFLMNYQNFGDSINFYLELSLVFLNIPLSFTFFLKIFILRIISVLSSFFILFILICMLLSSLSFINWLIYYSVSNGKIFSDQLSFYIIVFYFLFFLIYFFRFIKNNYIVLIG